MVKIFDSLRGLVNELSGLGGVRDKGSHGSWVMVALDRLSIDNAYRSNWMARKAVDIPAFDMLREGWSWEADKNDIAKLEKVERQHHLQLKLLAAQTYGRLYGGGALYMSDGNDSAEELNVSAIGDLKFITVLTRWELQSDTLDIDPTSEGYLQPTMYTVNSSTSGQLRVHPSRIVRFYGNMIPKQNSTYDDLWSDSILESVEGAIRNATAGQQGIAALIQESKIDVLKIKGLMSSISNAKYRAALIERNMLTMQTKSMTNALMIDGEDEWEQKQVSFSGLTDVQYAQMQVVSGAADIPATRFLGQSPAGMSSTGEHDMRNYYDRIGSDQELKLRPSQERVMNMIAVSALGAKPDTLWFKYNPLWQMTDKEQAEITLSNSTATKNYVDSGMVPKEVLAKATINQMIESGTWPGIETAYQDWEKKNGEIEFDEEFGTKPEPIVLPPVVGAAKALRNQPVKDRFADASPRSIYVSRQVINAGDILDWYRKQGVSETLAEDDLHVTVISSRSIVDWMKAGQDYWQQDGTLTIGAGGPRVTSRFDGGAIVLEFSASALSWRWQDIKRRTGAETSRDDYSPHVTITYDDGSLNVNDIEPWQGVIELGPEVFATVNDEWKAAWTGEL